jgi:hypothetical protein
MGRKVVKQNLQMTVGELIEILKKVPPEYKVECDSQEGYEYELTSLLICDCNKYVILGF